MSPAQRAEGWCRFNIYKSSLEFKRQKNHKFASFESMELLLKSRGKWIRTIIIYRPPPSAANKLNFPAFVEDFTTPMEELSIASGELLMFGDFNLHVDDVCDQYANTFLDLISSFGLKQHVLGVTHDLGHTLDLVITRSTEDIVSNFEINDPALSDHNPVHFKLSILSIDKPSFIRKEIVYRKWKSVDSTEFSADICQSSLHTSSAHNITDLVKQYNTVLGELADKHAPIITRTVTVRPRASWYTDEIASGKYLRRKLEHKWLNSKLTVDYMAYKQQCQQGNSMLLESKSVYYNSKINKASRNQKELFTILNKVLTVNKEPQLPSNTSLAELTDKFADFFMSNIIDIREQLKKSLRTPSLPTDQNDSQLNTKVCLSNFEPASIEEISKLIRDSPNKSCSLDPIPTWLTKKCIDVLAPLLICHYQLERCLMIIKMQCSFHHWKRFLYTKKCLTISGLFQIWSIFQSLLKKSLLLGCTVIWLTIICMRNYNLHTENFTVLKQHWHVYMMTYWGPLMTTKVYYLLCSIWVLLLIPLTMMYFWKDLCLDSVSVEQP